MRPHTRLAYAVHLLFTDKYTALTELPQILARMSLDQRSDYHIGAVLLSTVFVLSVFGALLVSGVLLIAQLSSQQQQRKLQALAEKARRLRWVEDDSEVILGEPVVPPLSMATRDVTLELEVMPNKFHLCARAHPAPAPSSRVHALT